MRIALAQLNQTVGDIAGNEQKILARLQEAREAGAQLVLFPELAIRGYPPVDPRLQEPFLPGVRAGPEGIAAPPTGLLAVGGLPERSVDVFNAAAVCAPGAAQA